MISLFDHYSGDLTPLYIYLPLIVARVLVEDHINHYILLTTCKKN